MHQRTVLREEAVSVKNLYLVQRKQMKEPTLKIFESDFRDLLREGDSIEESSAI